MLTVSTVLVTLALTGSAMAQSGVRLPSPQTSAISSPVVATGDLDRDGTIDLASSRKNGTSGLFVQRGRPDGSFAPREFVGPGGAGLIAGDLDGDGWLDLAAVSSNGRLHVYLNDGSGGFSAPLSTVVGEFLTLLRASDLDLDGDLDLVIRDALGGPGGLATLLGRGNGTFEDAVPHGFTGLYELADMNGDGLPDLIVKFISSVDVHLGVGDGTFSTVHTTNLGGEGFSALQVADLDRDGRQDVVLVRSDPDEVWVLKGLGTGQLAPPKIQETQPLWNTLTADDVDGDGILDVATSDSSQPLLWIFYGDGHGDLEPAVPVHTAQPAAFFATGPLLVMDLDTDGRRDLLGFGGDTQWSLLGSAPREYLLPSAHGLVGSRATALHVHDLDKDGWPDTLLATNAGLEVRLGRRWGALLPTLVSPVLPTAVVQGDATPGHFDGDDLLDVALVGRQFGGSSRVFIMHGAGDGRFELAADIPFAATLFDGSDILAGDFNEDGVDDLVATRRIGDTVGVLVSSPAGFVPASSVPVGDAPVVLSSGDFDADGHLDLAVANELSRDVTILLGAGDGSFFVGSIHAIGKRPSSVDVGDLDGDGVLDLVVASDAFTGVLQGDVLLGVGDGSFVSGPPPLFFAASIRVIDVTLDGTLDLVSVGSQFISVRQGLGDGSFAQARFYLAPDEAYALAVHDLDMNGTLDILTLFDEPFLGEPAGMSVHFNTEVLHWENLGLGSAPGGQAIPTLSGRGPLKRNTRNELRVGKAAPSAPAVLVVSDSLLLAPFAGGTLVPAPSVLRFYGTTTSGSLEISFRLPPDVPIGSRFYLQTWVDGDGDGIFETGSNGLVATTS